MLKNMKIILYLIKTTNDTTTIDVKKSKLSNLHNEFIEYHTKNYLNIVYITYFFLVRYIIW